MKKLVALSLVSLALAGCVNPGKASVQAEQLEGHRFVLESVNGVAIKPSAVPPEMSFGKKMAVSGVMCNRFSGQGKLSEGELKVKAMAMTRKLCVEPQLNELDATIGDMLSKGAQVDLTEDQLTLATAEKTLMFKRAE
ncbi:MULTISPECIES: heat shock protein HslJ [Lelliottia]|uniref:META domain-containing protein n=1 Tax=Lelliottia aquatilis TaxID=2080838 RepID=A0ABX5A8X4_9ENTR|nr:MULTISPECIES: heat shock protein HslJ [Lelliottia]ASV55622.1 Heat shock protein hslJ [Lelliottia jeotgali]MBL5882533.1 heat shock protein HslJ [Lelliottia aquatilis]NTZ44601.1 heat shock protein HslJ [Lelliottia aquatilis]POZ27144.1 META domain-containing protein [Lelliottia aquatilis]POZ33897.1 META domain-containing protein [Lelliottia aquatilis]